MRFVIVLGGERGCFGYQSLPDDFIVACDSGYDHAIALGLVPGLLIGDMDSIATAPSDISALEFSVRKDDTDCMLAIKEGLLRGYRDFVLLCGFGGRRTDHFLANLQSMLYLVHHEARVQMCGGDEWCTLIHSNTLELYRHDSHSLSVFALDGDAVGVTLEGVSYPLHNATVTEHFPIGVSNFITDEVARITVEDGTLLVICSPMSEQH